ncbi:hypothetical protein GCM10010496_49870 [Streptomyces asoensis]|nr:hypothetical protein GCM10010496_49870 [Streptomyces asoensis]
MHWAETEFRRREPLVGVGEGTADELGGPAVEGHVLAGTSTRTGSCTAGNPVRVRRRPAGYDSSVMLVAMPSVIFTVADREPAFAAFSSCASVHSTAA